MPNKTHGKTSLAQQATQGWMVTIMAAGIDRPCETQPGPAKTRYMYPFVPAFEGCVVNDRLSDYGFLYHEYNAPVRLLED